jgi:hypothetical protein
MPFCPVCRDEFRPGISTCPDHDVALVDVLPDQPREATEAPGLATELGIYSSIVAPLVVDLLVERGIDARLDAAEGGPYRLANASSAAVFVPADRLDDARRVVEGELADRLKQIEAAAATDAEFADTDDDQEEDPWALPAADDDDEDVEEVEVEPIGFMEPAVATVLIELCDRYDVFADPEYPLDQPAPEWARADGRVRMSVEQGFADPVMQIISEELPGELEARGIAAKEPLLEPEP